MPIIKAADLAYVRVRVPDLHRAETFMQDFGLVRAERTSRALYMRGAGPNHHIHITEEGPAKFLALGFAADTAEDLDRLSRLPGASKVERIEEPGGGLRVRLTDPDGHTVEVVHGISTVEPIRHVRHPLNDATDGVRRAGTLSRHKPGCAKVLRLGHAVLSTPDLPRMRAWYRDTLGLLMSDELLGPDGKEVALSFNRLDRGAEFVDHHVFLLQAGPKAGLNHVAFEVHDVDDLMLGHEHLRGLGYESVWGIGRHVYGAQIFDYWMDPFDFMYEHWTDSDRLSAQFRGVSGASIETAHGPWGQQVPHRFFTHAHE